MTEKLYYTDPYLASWKTTIKEIINDEDFCLVTLNETAFYPEGGGQPADKGMIDGISVLDVFEDNNEVYHKLPSPPLNQTVKCSIDWERRFDHMQQHTGQHLLSAVCIELYDAHTVSFHLGTDTVTIDLAIPTLTHEQMTQIEQRVNEYIYQNIGIDTYFVTAEQLSTIPVRKMPKVTEDIRIVQIGEIDYNACCGTHVTKLGELGLLKLTKTEKQKGNTRLHFKTGKRALQDYQKSHGAISTLSNLFSSHRDDIVEKAAKMEQENKQYVKELESLKNEILSYKAIDLVKEHDDNNLIMKAFDQYSIKEIQTLARHLFQLNDQLILILASQLENRLLFTHSGAPEIHCGQIMKEALKDINAKGGGNDKQAQATFQDSNTLGATIHKLKDLLPKQTIQG